MTAIDLIAQFATRHENREDTLRITQPTKEELRAAQDELETKTYACGRCNWFCENPNPGMPQFQMCTHAVRHRAIEAQGDEELRRTYQMTQVIWNEWDHLISYAELCRRGIDTLSIPRLAWQTWA
ncbi:hypothetical protein AB0395_34855 [Streptosporangium sp. NPDC051023]|uniref:hypothetical protein n=1 Tax=Streptosporangium sp. NPDC051023 TaxID=3155410 RepID=UPI003450F205